MRYKTKFNLLRDEVVKANNELVDNKIFETYMDEEQDTITITNAIVKALVKTIKFYEQADHKLYDAVTEKLEDARQELAGSNVFKAWLDFYLNDHHIFISEATALALPKTIWQLEQIVRDYKNEIEKQGEGLEKAEKVIRELKEDLEDQKLFTTDANNQSTRMSKYIVDLERENKKLEGELEENKEKLEKAINENKDFKHANLDLTKELKKAYDDLERFVETKEAFEKFRKENRILKSVNLDLRQEIIKGDRKLRIRNNEIAGLKHMLDRKDSE